MNVKDVLNQIIENRIKEYEIYSVIGTASNIDESARTCDVTPIEGAKIFDVQLQSVINGANGFVQIPTDSSKVIVTFLDKENAFVSLCSQVDKILIDSDTIEFNGGNNGGATNTADLVTKLNALVVELNNLKTFINTHIHTSAAPGSPTTIPTPLFTGSFSNFVATDFSDSNFTH